MYKIYGRSSSSLPSPKKKTRQGKGTYSKTAPAGGETFHENKRAGSTPSKFRRRRKAYRGQGK
jgi:hypothetical protein